MDTIKVHRMEVLAVVKENRKNHIKEFNQALKEWKKSCKKALKKALERAEKDGFIDLGVFTDLPKPVSYEKSYDNAIARLEMDVREEIELEDREFSAWVQDDWNWRGAFVASTSLYNNSGV
jgi:uncharacterized membrane protein